MRKNAVAIVCGSGPDLWDELREAQRRAPGAELIAVNLTGLFLPCVHHLVSIHHELLGPLRALRRSLDWCPTDRELPPMTHSWRKHPGVDRVWPLSPQGRGGTSSLYAVHVALGLGYARVILAGVPLDASRRFFDPPGVVPWRGGADPRGPSALAIDRDPWEAAARDWFAGRVTSVAGWTQELLGDPTAPRGIAHLVAEAV